MIYINYILLYSLIGFLMESVVFKVSHLVRQSGIFYGPYTLVYGFGVLLSILVYELIKKKMVKLNKYLRLFLYFLIFTILLTAIEYIGGHILKLVFDIDMWNYTSHAFHIGKYICLELAIIWGILGTINIYFLYPLIKKLSLKVPKWLTIISLIVFVIDVIFTIINKSILF